MLPRRDLLVEIGTEELPPKALRTLELAFAQELTQRLDQAGLRHAAVHSFATPRRLAVRVRRLAGAQADRRVQRRGPPVRAAFDPSGAPTRAAQAFAASCGVALEALGRERDERGGEYLTFQGMQPGALAATLLPQLVQQALEALPIPKRMRWATLEAQFARPVHWLVLLLGAEVVPARILEASAAAITRGHRFMAPRPLRLRAPGQYERLLRSRGLVIADFGERRERVAAQVRATADALGGKPIMPEALLEEVTALTEWPVALAGRFEERFLALPREVLIATLQGHQRYFAVEGAQQALLPWFITVSNIDSPEPEKVRAGNERVVRARLSDAAFFWEQDRRTPLAARTAGLDAVSFQAQLGSVGERAQRLGKLARSIGMRLGADAAHTARAAALCKCDLLTAMVGEFPELQGQMGRRYALADGESPEVAEAIAEHYLPRSAGDALPASLIGDVLALADKLDLVAGIFSIGQRPSGTKDPFGLRRAVVGLLRIVREHRREVDLHELIGEAVGLQPAPAPVRDGEGRARLGAEIFDYVMERLRALLLEAAPAGQPAMEAGGSAAPLAPVAGNELFDAVLATRPGSVLDFEARLTALARFIARPEGASLAAANKRIANILRKSEATAELARQPIEPRLLREPAERALHEAVVELAPQVLAAVRDRAYGRALDLLSGLKPAVDEFFDRVLVNDPDEALRANRFALLGGLRAQFVQIAELSRLPG